MNNIHLLLLATLPVIVASRYKRIVTTVIFLLLAALYSSMAITSLCGIEVEGALSTFQLTPLASIFSLLFCTSALTTILADRPFVDKSPLHYSIFYSCAIVLLISLSGVLGALSPLNTATDVVLPFAMNWELMGLSSFAILLLESERRGYFHSAVNYFIVMHVGFFFILGGLLMCEPSTGAIFGSGALEFMPWLLIFVGFGLKSAIFPLHFWLPSTYGSSLGAGTALMAGTSTNVGTYGILMMMYSVQDVEQIALILSILGLIAALYGSFAMIRCSTFYRLLSCSSMENLGVIVFGIGFSFLAKSYGATSIATVAIIGAMVKLFTHGVTKAMLLTISGNIRRCSGTDEISKLGGLASRIPFATSFFGLSALSLSGMPLFGGFVAEFMFFVALVMAVSVPSLSIVAVSGIIVLALASASTIFNITKAFTVGFLGAARGTASEKVVNTLTPLRKAGYWLSLILFSVGGWAIAYLLITNVKDIFVLSSGDMSWMWEMITGIAIVSGAVLLLIIALWWFRKSLHRGIEVKRSDTWGCGSLNGAQIITQPSAESFSYEANVVATLPVRPRTRRKLSRQMSPIRNLGRWTSRLALFQTGRTSHYVLHIIWFLALVLILTLIDVL